MYSPRNVPYEADDLPAFLTQELRNISQASLQPVEYQLYKVLHVAPSKLMDGMEVLADGTDWNPGSGAGKYYYLSGAWHFLG